MSLTESLGVHNETSIHFQTIVLACLFATFDVHCKQLEGRVYILFKIIAIHFNELPSSHMYVHGLPQWSAQFLFTKVELIRIIIN